MILPPSMMLCSSKYDALLIDAVADDTSNIDAGVDDASTDAEVDTGALTIDKEEAKEE